MAFDYEDAGTFGSEREAKDWAQEPERTSRT